MDTQRIDTKSTDHRSLQALMNYKYNTVSVNDNSSYRLSKMSLLTGGLLMAIILVEMHFILIAILVVSMVIGFLLSKIK